MCLFTPRVGAANIFVPVFSERFGLFHLFTLLLEEFDYTARVQQVLHATGYS